MNKLLNDGILSSVDMDESDGEGSISVVVSKAGEVGSFSEEERSRQVSFLCLFCLSDCVLSVCISYVNCESVHISVCLLLQNSDNTSHHLSSY